MTGPVTTGWWAEQFVLLQGIPSAEAFGDSPVTPGPTNVALTGIPSAEAFGAMNVKWDQNVAMTGIPSAEAFGDTRLFQGVSLTGIPSAEAFGTLQVNQNVVLTGIPSAEAFGDTTLLIQEQVEIVGVAASHTTSVTIPSHVAGDLILLWVYRGNSNTQATKPSAGGSVPAYIDVGTPLGGANTNTSRGAYFIATGAGHTSGTWTNATDMIAIILRGVDPVHPIGGNLEQNGTATTVTAPAVDLWDVSGLSKLLHFFGGRAITSWASAPANYTRQIETAASGVAGALNTKNSSTTDGSTSQGTQTSTGYRGQSIEVRKSPNNGYVTPRIAHGTGPVSTTGSFQVTVGANDRIVLFVSHDRPLDPTFNVDGVAGSFKLLGMFGITGAFGDFLHRVYISDALSAGTRTVNYTAAIWTNIAAAVYANAVDIAGIPQTATGTNNCSQTVSAPVLGHQWVQSFGVGNSASLASPSGGMNRVLSSSNASITLSDADDAATFAVTKTAGQEWSGIAVDLSPTTVTDIRWAWERPIARLTEVSSNPVSISNTADAGDTVIVNILVDRSASISGCTYGGVAMTQLGVTNFSGADSGAVMARYGLTNVTGGAQTVAPSITAGFAWIAMEAINFHDVSSIGTTTVTTGVGSAPTHSVTPSAGELVVQSFGAVTGLAEVRGGWQISFDDGAARLATQIADAATTFSGIGSQNWASMITRLVP